MEANRRLESGMTDNPDGCHSPTSSVEGVDSVGLVLSGMPNMSPKVEAFSASNQTNVHHIQKEQSYLKPELLPQDNSLMEESSVEVSSTQSLKNEKEAYVMLVKKHGEDHLMSRDS